MSVIFSRLAAKQRKATRFLAAAFFCAVILCSAVSCIGVKADITMNSDNTGTITVEYRVSKLLDSLGKQDGNENYPPIPVGKTDIEQSVARLPGIKLLSYNSRSDANDTVVTVKLHFDNPEALIAFLDASGSLAVYTKESNTSTMAFTLAEAKSGNPEMESVLSRISAGYTVAISMSFPTAGKLLLLDAEGSSLREESTGRTVTCSIPLETVLLAEKGIRAEFTW